MIQVKGWPKIKNWGNFSLFLTKTGAGKQRPFSKISPYGKLKLDQVIKIEIWGYFYRDQDLKYRRKSPDVSPWMEWVPTKSDMRSMRGRIPRT